MSVQLRPTQQLTCWLGSCSFQGRLQSFQCASRCPWTSRPDSVPALKTSLLSSAPAHLPYGGCMGTWPHSWIKQQTDNAAFKTTPMKSQHRSEIKTSLCAFDSLTAQLDSCPHLCRAPPAQTLLSDPEESQHEKDKQAAGRPLTGAQERGCNSGQGRALQSMYNMK